MKTQKGAAMVEFAFIAMLFFVILFGIIEFARAMFVYNTLVEATRRGARTAAVCPPNNINGSTAKIKNVVLFNDPYASGNGMLGLAPSDVYAPKYFKSDMSPWTYNPTSFNGVVVGNIDEIAFVQVSISDFQQSLFIPGFNAVTIPTEATITTLPSESLGRTTANNPLAAASRNCF